MALEREELQANKPDKAAERQMLTGLAQAALKAEAITGDPSWDYLTSIIQQALNVAGDQRKQYADLLSSPKLVNPDQISQIRNELLIRDERIRCLGWVITAPAEIKRVGSVAKEKLAALDVKDAEAEVPDAA